jgi:hypothetical protein
MTVPVEPMFTLDTVAQIIPMTLDGLRAWLKRHKAELSEPVYARKGWGPRVSLIRLLTASDVRKIRQDQIRPPRRVVAPAPRPGGDAPCWRHRLEPRRPPRRRTR